ncbi:unnamed protein product [Choristocarpus tenellus]
MEVADAIIVNKADGALDNAARATASDYASALCFNKRKFNCWEPPVLRCSSLQGTGIDIVWDKVLKFHETMDKQGLLSQRRQQQAKYWMMTHLGQHLVDRAERNSRVQALAK